MKKYIIFQSNSILLDRQCNISTIHFNGDVLWVLLINIHTQTHEYLKIRAWFLRGEPPTFLCTHTCNVYVCTCECKNKNKHAILEVLGKGKRRITPLRLLKTCRRENSRETSICSSILVYNERFYSVFFSSDCCTSL